MYKRKRSVFVESASYAIYDKEKEKRARNKSKSITNLEEHKLMDEGYKSAMDGISSDLLEDKLNNPFFKSGYLRGIRTLNAKKYLENEEIVRKMVANNIPFEMASEEIKNNANLKSLYDLEKMRSDIKFKRR